MSCQHESHQRPVAPTSKPLPESLQWLEDDLGTIKSNDLFRPVRTRLGRQAGTVISAKIPDAHLKLTNE